jgi:hypothetical protein
LQCRENRNSRKKQTSPIFPFSYVGQGHRKHRKIPNKLRELNREVARLFAQGPRSSFRRLWQVLSSLFFALFEPIPVFVLLLSAGTADEREFVPSDPGILPGRRPRTAIPAFETTTTGTRRFASTLSGHSPEDFDGDHEERKVTTRAEPVFPNRQRQEETVVFSTSKNC